MKFTITYDNYRELMKSAPEDGVVLLSADVTSQMVALTLGKELSRRSAVVMTPGYIQVEIYDLRRALFNGDEITFTYDNMDVFRYYSGTVRGTLP